MDFFDDEKKISKKIGQSIHTSLGYIYREIRLMSPLSHNEMAAISPISSRTSQRLENKHNFSIHTYMEAIYYHLHAIKCTIYLRCLSIQIVEAIESGKCIVIETVDFSELSGYKKEQIILLQHSVDLKELKRRKTHKCNTLHIARKLNTKRYSKKCEKEALKGKKKKK